MALPSSGQISFADLQSEYGGTNPISISEFRGSRYNPSATDSGPGYQIYDVSYNSSNNKLAFNGTDADYLFLNTDEKIVMICESGVWNDGNLYFSSTTTPGNNNLLGTGVNAASVGVGQMMVLDGADSSPTFTLVDLNTYGNVGGMPDNTWTVNYMEDTFAGSTMSAIYLKSAALFSTATGTFNNGTDTLHILNADGSVFLSIDSSVDALTLPGGGNGTAVFYLLFTSDYAALSGSASYNTAKAAATTKEDHEEALFDYFHANYPKSSWPVNTLKVNTALPFVSSTTGTLIGYLKSNNTTNATAVRVYLVTDPGNTANQVNYLYGRCRFTFSDAGSFVGGSRNTHHPFLRSIDNTENGVILPNNKTFSWNQDMTALPTIWSGGTWHYIYFLVYDATWDNSTKTYSFDNFRNIAWTNNTSYTNGSGTYLGGSGQANNATNVANVLASTAGYNTARTPNYAGTSESINLTMSNSGTRLDGTMTNTTGNDILLYKYTMSNSTGFPAGSNNRLMSLAWADSSNAFTNSHTVNSTGCFNTFRRTHYGYPTWLRLQFYFTPAGSGTEADIGYFNFVFEDAVSQSDALQFIKTQTEGFFHDALDTGEDYPYLRATVNADSIDFHYYRQGILRVVPTYYRFGYNQGGSGGTAYPSTADSALQAHSNYNFATTKSNELNTFAKGNGNIKAQTLNMSLADYYDGRGNLTLGSG